MVQLETGPASYFSAAPRQSKEREDKLAAEQMLLSFICRWKHPVLDIFSFFPASNYIEVVFLIDLSTSSNMGIGSLLYLMISHSLWLYFMQISAYY